MPIYIIYTKEKCKIETDNYNDFDGLTYHREDGPAYQRFNNGQLIHEVYYINGKMHRLDGPAYQAFYDNAQLDYEAYYINGEEYSKSEYEAELFKMKLALLCQDI